MKSICIDAWNQAGLNEVSMTCRSAATGHERNDADIKMAILNNTTKGNTNMTAEVRRLTVEECEKLMGFPNGHTRPMSSDANRYAGCGNSWAANCARVVIKGIHKVNDRLSRK